MLKKRQVFVIIPVGLPGMGKTTFINSQMKDFFNQTDSCKFLSISSDSIRKQTIDDYLEKNPKHDITIAFEATYK